MMSSVPDLPPSALAEVAGRCDPRFAPLREAFAGNFAERGELGAALCVTLGGRTVADLWGGWADVAGTRPWGPDTLVDVCSIGKGLTAVCAARLAGQARIEVDAPVTRYWPEFAAAGKDAITVRQILSHQAGLPAIRRRMPPGSMLDWDVMTAALAAQEPWWPPGTGHGYHANTFGFLLGEIVRRATGATIGTILRAEVAGPAGADVHIGLPASAEARTAEFIWPGQPPPEDEPAGLDDTRLMAYNAYFNPGGLSGAGVVNTRAWRLAEVPSANAHASARGVARIFTVLAAGGLSDGQVIVDPGALAAAAVQQVYGHDLLLDRPSRFGLGFQLTQPERPLGPGPAAFGHFGAGGSVGFCDPDLGLAFGYVTSRLEPGWQNPRNRALMGALGACL
jgi:CubicO group peptidase (beta-lactamase class C family)